MTDDIEDFEAMRALVKDAIGRLMNVQFDLQYDNSEQALQNARQYVKLTRDGLIAIDDRRNERSVTRARNAASMKHRTNPPPIYCNHCATYLKESAVKACLRKTCEHKGKDARS